MGRVAWEALEIHLSKVCVCPSECLFPLLEQSETVRSSVPWPMGWFDDGQNETCHSRQPARQSPSAHSTCLLQPLCSPLCLSKCFQELCTEECSAIQASSHKVALSVHSVLVFISLFIHLLPHLQEVD